MRRKKVILWFQKDLRIHDNEALLDASSFADEVIPVYVFDEREMNGITDLLKEGKTGKYRKQFLLDSVKDLKESLKGLGTELIIREGKSEDILFSLAKEFDVDAVYCNRERTREEEYRQEMLEKLFSLARSGQLKSPEHDLVSFNDFQIALEQAMPAQGMHGKKQILIFD